MRRPWQERWHFTYGDRELDAVVMPEFMAVTIYKDTTGQYTDAECDEDNMVEIPVPDNLFYQWWLEDLETNKEHWGADAWEDGSYETFDHWFRQESTADDTDTLYDWLCKHDYYWKRLD